MAILTLRRTLAALALVAATAALWITLAPRALGGSVSYVIVSGSSMLPHLHQNDLVIARPSATYHQGDVVLYRNRQLQRMVVHRIVRVRADGRFVIKGDNNGFLDEPPARQADIVGKLWLRVPSVGVGVRWLRDPRHSAVLAGLMVLFAMGGVGATTARRRRRGPERRPRIAHLSAPLSSERLLLTGLAGAGAVGVAGLVLAALSFSRSPQQTVSVPDLYGQTGRFSYSATAPAGVAYPDGAVHTGEAIYPQLVDRVSFAFDYRFHSAAAHGVGGRATLVGILSDGQGWTRKLQLAGPTRFTGDHVRLGGTVNVTKLERSIQDFVAETGSDTGAYTFSVRPHVHVAGAVAGQSISDDLSGDLGFHVDPLRIVLLPRASSTAPSPLSVSRSTEGEQSVANTLRLAGLSLDVTRARSVAVFALAGAGAAALVLGLLLLLARREDELVRIPRRYGAWLVDVAEYTRDAAELVRVDSFESLLRISDRYDRLILHEQRGGAHAFIVEEDGIAYWYAPQPEAGRPVRSIARNDVLNLPTAVDAPMRG